MEPCNTTFAGCAVTDSDTMTGECHYHGASEQIMRVFERKAVSQVCPDGCFEEPEIVAESGSPETCFARGSDDSAVRAASCIPCTAAMGTAGAGACSGEANEDEAAVCSGYTSDQLLTSATCDATTKCFYVEALICALDVSPSSGDGSFAADTIVNYDVDGTTVLTGDFATDATETSAISGSCTARGNITGIDVYDNSNCKYTAATPAVEPAAGNCTQIGAAGTDMFPGAKELVVGTENKDCEKDKCVTKGVFMGNCTKVDETFSFNGRSSTLGIQCNTCWDHWQYKVIDDIKGNLWPATITVFALFLFIVILVSVNLYMIDNQVDDDDGFAPEGIFKILGLVFNGIVGLFGLIVIIAASVIYYDLQEGCPEGEDCTNTAIIGLIVTGVFCLLTVILAVVGMILAGIVGMMLIRIANIVFMVLCLVLLICGIAFAVIAGALDETNKQYEENFDSVRAQYESQDPTVCLGMNDAACRDKIRDMAASSNTTIVVVLGLINLSFLFVMFLTLEAFYIFKGGDDDYDDDDDDE